MNSHSLWTYQSVADYLNPWWQITGFCSPNLVHPAYTASSIFWNLERNGFTNRNYQKLLGGYIACACSYPQNIKWLWITKRNAPQNSAVLIQMFKILNCIPKKIIMMKTINSFQTCFSPPKEQTTKKLRKSQVTNITSTVISSCPLDNNMSTFTRSTS